MGYATEATTHRARKPKRCSWCYELIVVKEPYRRYRCFNDGSVTTISMHQECFDDMQEAAQQEGGWYEWIPGSADRPLKPDEAHS